MEELSRIDVSTAPAVTVTPEPALFVEEVKLEQLPPPGPYKPTSKEIQMALKNAGFYAGVVDGKIGPQSKKAITDFQKANNLQADGKVGPKTWMVLGKYLNPAPTKPGENR
jgi:peptidoglycan hydrolase-like protein with peptidoglycan-binding domain